MEDEDMDRELDWLSLVAAAEDYWSRPEADEVDRLYQEEVPA